MACAAAGIVRSNRTIPIVCCAIAALSFRAAAVTYDFVHINFFTQDVVESGGSAVFKYFPFKFSDDMAAIAGVNLTYIMDNGPPATLAMTRNGDCFSAAVPAVPPSAIDYYYSLQCVPLTGTGTFASDTKWFTKTMGMAFGGEAVYPLLVQCSGRFRDGHENELGADRFPGAAYAATVYTLVFKDYGDSIELAVFPSANSSSLELHAFNHVPVDSACKRAEYALNMGSSTNLLVSQHTGPGPAFPQGSPYGAVPWYTATIASVATGELVDFELSLTEAPSGTVQTSAVHRYYVGDGRLGQQYQHPWANAAGAASVSVVTEPAFGFGQQVVDAAPGRSLDFLTGRTFFCTDWSTSMLRNAGPLPVCNGGVTTPANDRSPFVVSGALGPRYLQESCYECHREAGPGHPPDSAGDSLDAIVFLGVTSAGMLSPHPVYGDMLRCKATGGMVPDGNVQVSYTFVTGTFGSGESYELRKPLVNFVNLSHGPLGSDAVYSYRISPFLCGAGLLAAIPDSAILSRADPDDRDGDGISGRPFFAVDPVDGTQHLGRFGYKASMPSLVGQIAYCANRCLGLTNRYFPVDSGGGIAVELPDSGLSALLSYAALLAPPQRKNWRDSAAIRGKALFGTSGCGKCHVPAMRTGVGNRFAELDNLEIQPFTDLLLHDMGPGLADAYGSDSALGSEWRTAPLWGLGYVADGTGRSNYLHDGRARSILEAILWHGGEAEKAKNAVLGFSVQQRQDLVAFCEYPFADRLPRPLPSPVAVPCRNRGLPPDALLCRRASAQGIIRFSLPQNRAPSQPGTGAAGSFSIYNMRGQCVFRRSVAATANEILWDGNCRGPGKYLAEFRTGARVCSVGFLVVK